MLKKGSIQELVEAAEKLGQRISDVVLDMEAQELEESKEKLFEKMAYRLAVMRQSVIDGLDPEIKTLSGLSGGNAAKLKRAVEEKRTFSEGLLSKMLVKALAVSELNACMGRIVAAPTAGSCGILPAVLITAMEEKNIPEHEVVMSLFTAAGIGRIIAEQASISGAEGGCQAECGSASAMAAAALVELMGGTPRMCANACAIALKNTLGLICDPVAGLVEIPCIKRNTMGAANAMVAAELSLAGIESVIPADEVIWAMNSVSKLMAPALKETAEGGLAATPTGRRIAEELIKKYND